MVNDSAFPFPDGHVAFPLPKPGTPQTETPRKGFSRADNKLHGRALGAMLPLEPDPEKLIVPHRAGETAANVDTTRTANRCLNMGRFPRDTYRSIKLSQAGGCEQDPQDE